MRAALFLPAIPLFALATACGADPATGGAGGTASTSTSATTSSTVTTSTPSSTMTTSTTTTTTSSTSATGVAPFSLLSLNLHCFKLDGTSFATNAARFAAIAELAAARGVAVMAVQEACRKGSDDAIAMLRQALETATGASWSATWAEAHVAWQGTADEADEGVGLLVRGALSAEDVLVHATQGSFRRVAVSATLPPELGGARVTSVHFEVFEAAARAAQAREAAAAALVDSDPGFVAVVAGDFNDVEGSAPVAAFPAMGYVDATKGIDATGIDHVMVHRAATLRATATERVFLGANAVSDHPGILVRLEPATGDAVTATRVRALYDPGAGHTLAIRGSQAPLTWGAGFAMRRKSSGEHAFVCTELAGGFELKTLVDDSTWQTGSNVACNAGDEIVVTPSF